MDVTYEISVHGPLDEISIICISRVFFVVNKPIKGKSLGSWDRVMKIPVDAVEKKIYIGTHKRVQYCIFNSAVAVWFSM